MTNKLDNLTRKRAFLSFNVRELYRHCHDFASIVRDLRAARAAGIEPFTPEELGLEFNEYYHVRDRGDSEKALTDREASCIFRVLMGLVEFDD